MFENAFEDFKTVYEEAIEIIVRLRESAEEIKRRMDDIIDSCENIESEL